MLKDKKSVKNFDVIYCTRPEIEDFIKINHYSKSINGCDAAYCFKLMDNKKILGAAFFGRMAMANQWKKFSDNQNDVIELRRLCCIDETPKNTESYFISRMIKWLKNNSHHKIIVSYADEEHGHKGTIYKASNFEYLGKQKGAKVIFYQGKNYHDKTIRTKYNGEIKPYAKKILDALSNGEAIYKNTAGKHTYIYRLKNAS
jgi:hypothetical protein